MNPDLVTLPFDHYQRYGATAALLSEIGGEPISRVLEVGANRQRILKSFMPESHFVFSDLEAQEPVSGSDDIFVQADATRLPFSDKDFDAVVSLDVMEHIPAHLRARATEEMARAAKRCVVIGCPLDLPWVHEAEKKANSIWERYFGEAYPWLDEHNEFGLVDPDVVESTLKSSGFHVIRFGQGDADVWAGMMSSHFIKEAVQEFAGLVGAADRLYNESVFAGDRSARAYREFFIGVRSDDDHTRLKASSFLNAEPNPAARTLLSRFSDRLIPVVDRLKLAEREWQATAAVTRRLEATLGEEAAARSQLQAERARLTAENEALRDEHREIRDEHRELREEHKVLCQERYELLELLRKSQDATDQAHTEVLEMARAGRTLIDSTAILRDRVNKLAQEQTELESYRQLLAGRVVTLERRQLIAKWAIGLAGICTIGIVLHQMIH